MTSYSAGVGLYIEWSFELSCLSLFLVYGSADYCMFITAQHIVMCAATYGNVP